MKTKNKITHKQKDTLLIVKKIEETMKKITFNHKAFNADDIRSQFKKLEKMAFQFSQEIAKLQQEQEDFVRQMRQQNLFH